jgi:hypothetical protein
MKAEAVEIAQIAATLMSAGQLGINDIDQAVDKAVALIKRAEAVKELKEGEK